MGLLGLSLTATGLTVGSSAAAAPQPEALAAAPSIAEPAHAEHDLPNPLEAKRRALRQEGLSEVLSGRAKAERINGSTVVKVGERAARGGEAGPNAKATKRGRGPTEKQYVELSREQTDQIFVILAEFGNDRHPSYPDQDTDPDTPGPTRFDGPLHNEIPEPDRSVDNSTVWQADYDADHYRKLYFGTGSGDQSVKQYYEAQSSGRYSVDGVVTDWVKVQYNEARYGRSSGYPCEGIVCNNVWALVRDAANQWVADQKAAGRTDEEIAADVRAMDEWDRYDHDSDGNFNEPDGYIDHFQIVHAGGDMADGDPIQGEDAIWSHRWYAYASDQGRTGPSNFPAGGTQIGDTGVWIGDYTIQPENGGRSVFYHEYAHDLGLPDDYNVISGGDNNNEHWTLMAQSRLGAKNDGGIGERGGDLGAWNKLQLGWLDYEVIVAGQKRTLTLGPQEYNTKEAQAAVVVLPEREYTFDNGAPFEGDKQFFSGNADDLNSTMTRTFDLTGKSAAALSMKGRYSIEADYDYLFFETSVDGGQTWTSQNGTVDGEPLKEISPGRFALDGSSDDEWVDIEIPLDQVAGDSVAFRLRYQTDGGVSEGGFFGDAVALVADGETVFTDGAESDADGWTLAGGFEVVEATYTRNFANYYIAGTRQYISYDRYLKTGPYFFGYGNTKPDYVDHYAYQEGLLISYWNTRWADNDTFAHPGEGRNMIIDAHPRPIYNLTGQPWRARIQVYDAPFGLKKADSFTLHLNSQPQYIRGQAAQPLFDDTKKYWFPELPNHGVKLPATGTKIKVLEQKGIYTKVRFS
ncbi:immune inhibitor A domain-containing protein [Verrucosispora sp. WMMD573]|uniref:immune inhibitor A domain-containing protein n=1 Tax=Verrucosispora sp. WMMD573 TaxID=3015149 RepID=UPI00248B817F|nr:immune inhibitor A domain-containing protein [Verrucosispora sp. WMMD573]WBB57388.1 immune inhibitor A [Verrucosispora sp. WMMD573]